MVYKKLIVNTDGGARGNPGPAGIGIIIVDEEGKKQEEYGEYIGRATNNHAEYMAVIKALEILESYTFEELELRLDSELVVKQLNGEYKVKNENLMILFVNVWNKLQSIKKISIKHVPRKDNKQADALVNKALDLVVKN